MSLVDPKISRDGVPLCSRHADATTPPLGWTMNDLRSRNRALSAVPDEGSVPTSTPPRVRPDGEEQSGRRMSRRQSIAERARQLDSEPASAEVAAQSENDHKFKSSRPAEAEEPAAATAEAGQPADDEDPQGPSSRPNRRRDVAEEVPEEEDKFPWHFQFDDDEPEELHASSPLLSRAFRSSIG